MVKFYLSDNMSVNLEQKVELIYADMIYEDMDFPKWIDKYWGFLNDNGIFIIQTDYHSVAEVKTFMGTLDNSNFVNWCIYVQEWGGTPRKGFPQKHDDILIYSKGKDFYWNKDSIQVPKATAGTKFDKKGTGLKTPCSVFYDLGNFSTMSKERIKTDDGHNIRWQKPVKLMERLILPFTKEGDTVLDIFMGSGTTGYTCKIHGRNFIGIESDAYVYNLAVERITKDEI